MAFADNALFGYENLEDIRQQEIPEGEDELILRFNDNALDRPILRRGDIRGLGPRQSGDMW